MITVHHLNNSRSQRVLWLLEELELTYDIKHYTRDKVTSLAPVELLNIHPLGKSPMIEDDGRLISESGAIVEYLCEKFGSELIPEAGTDASITHKELMHFAEGSVMTPILLALYVGKLGDAGLPLQPRIKEQLESHFKYVEQMLRPSGHFVLDTLSAVDIMMIFPAEVAIHQGWSTQLPNLANFVRHCHRRPGFQAALEKGGPYRYAQ